MKEFRKCCVLLADRHHAMVEAIRDMLETSFDTLYIVADDNSLVEGATRLHPAIVIVDLSLLPSRAADVLQRIRNCSPRSKTLLLSVHSQASIAQFALDAEADGLVLKSAIASDLFPAIDALLANRRYVSPGFERAGPVGSSDTIGKKP
jgi:DNA-binding NarL/FixJ family response regulator